MTYTDTLEDVDKVLLQWLNVIGEFTYRYDRLNRILSATHTLSSDTAVKRPRGIQNLLLLREHLKHTMSTLLTDMTPSFLPSPLPTYSRLQVHIRLLDELNRKIDAELALVSTKVQG